MSEPQLTKIDLTGDIPMTMHEGVGHYLALSRDVLKDFSRFKGPGISADLPLPDDFNTAQHISHLLHAEDAAQPNQSLVRTINGTKYIPWEGTKFAFLDKESTDPEGNRRLATSVFGSMPDLLQAVEAEAKAASKQDVTRRGLLKILGKAASRWSKPSNRRLSI